MNSLASESRRTMRQALRSVCVLIGWDGDPEIFPWHRLRRGHVLVVRAKREERYEPAGANKSLTALRRVLTECRRLGLMSADDCEDARDVAPVRGSRTAPGRALESGEVQALYDAIPGENPIDLRDAAILTALSHGLRRSEVVTLDLEDYRRDRRDLHVLGKRN